VSLCRQNVAANRFAQRASVHLGNLERPLATLAPELVHAADLVVTNPPYFTAQRDGRTRSDASNRRSARHGDLHPFLRAASEALGRRGRVCLCYPAQALLEVTTLARQSGLEPKRMRLVHGRPDRPARIALLELSPGKPGGLVVEPPLIETEPNGRRSAEIDSLLVPR
jgi:tRNA1Val (adenine37-N6)-methyltransferase